MRNHPIGLPAPGEVQSQVPWSRGVGGSQQTSDETGHGPSGNFGKFGEVHRNHHGTFCWEVAVLVESQAGSRNPRGSPVCESPSCPTFRRLCQDSDRIPWAKMQKEYASEVQQKLSAAGLWTDVDNGENTLQKKIRNGEIAQYNFILVVGQEELDGKAVNVRNRDDVGEKKARAATVPLDTLIEQLVTLKGSRSLSNKIAI